MRRSDTRRSHTCPGSRRRTQAAALDTLARALSGGRLGGLELPWHLLRYPRTAAVRSWLAERYQAVTARTYLSALRDVLRECWRLELLSTDEYERARDLEAVRGKCCPGAARSSAASCAPSSRPWPLRSG